MKRIGAIIAAVMLLTACTQAREPERHWKAIRNTGTCIIYVDQEGNTKYEPLKSIGGGRK